MIHENHEITNFVSKIKTNFCGILGIQITKPNNAQCLGGLSKVKSGFLIFLVEMKVLIMKLTRNWVKVIFSALKWT